VYLQAQSVEEHEMWLDRLQANTADLQQKKADIRRLDLVGEMSCGFGAVKCMTIVDGRVWAGTRGGISAWNILEQRYTGAIKMQKSGITTTKGGDDLETQFVTSIVPHKNYVWCAVGPSIVRIDPKTRQLVDWFDGHTSLIDDMVLFGECLWSCSAMDHTLRTWNTLVHPARFAAQIIYRKIGSVFENYEGQTLGLVTDVLWVGGADGTVRIWDPSVKTVQKTLEKKHTAEITAIAMTGRTVWVASADGSISVWLVS